MSEFSHSIVLFSGEDGLPMEFNIQNTIEKVSLKAMIEYGGGLCTLDADAIYLVSPGTTVINVDANKKVISSRYVFDCVKQNYLLDIDDYKVEVKEVEASDFSEENSLHFTEIRPKRPSDNDSEDMLDPNKTVSRPDSEFPKSNHVFDFEGTNDVECHKEAPLAVSPSKPLLRELDEIENISHVSVTPECVFSGVQKTSDGSVQTLPNVSDSGDEPFFDAQNFGVAEEVEIISNLGKKAEDCNFVADRSLRESPVGAILVSSSQSNGERLDHIDNRILNKSKEKPPEQEDECLSQSYTVSSSADAQIPSSKPSPHDTSAEIFGGVTSAPDSASQNTERQQYIKDLEKEIEKILRKPSPKSIQDKAVLVKYICCVKKLSPAIVLQTLQNF